MILTLKFPQKPLVIRSLTLLTIALIWFSCSPQQDQSAQADPQTDANPAATGFDMDHSDPQAIAIADEVMEAMGGRHAWDNTRYISWDFFGNRKLIWDKHSGRVRIDFPDGTTYLVDINDNSGKAYKNGAEVTHPDSLAQELDRAKRIWINDSYWLVMPFKLKDSGVTLKHQGLEKTEGGASAHVLELTFENVGVTPQNRYLVYVDTSTKLVSQWSFFREAGQDTANFVLPWRNYQQHGGILLSDNRGERELSDVRVFETLPEEIFTSLEPVELSNYH